MPHAGMPGSSGVSQMEAERLITDANSPVSTPVVGARGANAAQRAAESWGLDTPAAEKFAPRAPVEAPQPEARQPAAEKPAAGAKAPLARSRRKMALLAAAAIIALGGAWYSYDYLTAGRFIVSTDDAYVRADATT